MLREFKHIICNIRKVTDLLIMPLSAFLVLTLLSKKNLALLLVKHSFSPNFAKEILGINVETQIKRWLNGGIWCSQWFVFRNHSHKPETG